MKIKNPKICLLGASFGTNNLGVNALTAGTLKAFYESYPEGELFLFDYGRETATYNYQRGDRTVPVQLVNIRFSKKFYLRNNIAFLIVLAIFARCIPFASIRKSVISHNFWLNSISGTDIVVSMAGGDSFTDIYGMGRFLYVALPQLLALILGQKLVLLPQTIGPFRGFIAKAIARSIMQRAEVIYSRDRIGLKETRNLLGSRTSDDKVRFCYDVGFIVDPLKPSRMDLAGLLERVGKTSPLVGFNISGLLFMGGYTQNNMFGLKVDYRQLVFDVLEHLIRQKDVTVLLVPHVSGRQEHAESDSSCCERIYNELRSIYPNRLYTVCENYDHHEIKYIIGLCEFFIGSRMHACIAALSQNIPAVSIAYSKKFYGVMQSIGVESLVADPRKLDKAEIMNILDEAYERRVALRAQLLQTIPHVKETVLALFKEMC